MTRTQWRRYQRSKKGIVAKANNKVVNPKEKYGYVNHLKILSRKLVKNQKE